MDKRKGKAIVIPVLMFCIGGIIGGYAVSYYLGKFMAWGVYMDAAASANIYVSVLNELKGGGEGKAIEYLEMHLSDSELMLKACEEDLCKESAYPEVEGTLKLIESYRQGNG